MALQIRRYRANTSDIDVNQNNTSIRIPAQAGFADLTSSSLVLDMQLNATDTNGTVLIPITFGQDGQLVDGPAALLNNSVIKSDRYGVLNESTTINVVNANLQRYLKSRSQVDQESLFGQSTNANSGIDRRSWLPDNPWLDYLRPSADGATITATATNTSVKRRAEVPVPWHVIDEFGNMANFPFLAMGNYHVDLEFEKTLEVISPATMPRSALEACNDINLAGGDDEYGTTDNPIVLTKSESQLWKYPAAGQRCVVYAVSSTGTATHREVNRIEDVTLTAGTYSLVLESPIAAAAADDDITDIFISYSDYLDSLPVLCNTITPTANEIGSAAHPLVIPNHYSGRDGDYQECQFYLGAPLSIVAMEANTQIQQYEDKVLSLTRDGDDLQIVLDTPFDVGSNNPQTFISVGYRYGYGLDRLDLTWTINELYAKLYLQQLPPADITGVRRALEEGRAFDFIAKDVDRKNMNAGVKNAVVLETDPNCVGLLALTPQTLTLMSGNDSVERYRWYVNQKPHTNRTVYVGDADYYGRSLHNLMLKRFFRNLGTPLKKYDSQMANYEVPDDETTGAVYPLVVPKVPEKQTVELQLFSATGSSMSEKVAFYVFFQHKQLIIDSNGARVESVNLV